MTKTFLLAGLCVLFCISAMAQNNVGIGTTTPNASAALDVTSTTQGMLVPRMTEAQRGAIAAPVATGLLVYQTDGTAGFYFYNGTGWTSLSDNLGNHTATTNLAMGGNNITGANNVTATGTATLGGNAYPTTTGSNGQVLTTDGAGALSWGSASSGGGATLQLSISKTVAQTTAIGSSLSLPDIITFESANGTGAMLTNGNTWTSNNKFTVGATGTGLYLVDVELMSNASAIPCNPMIDMNGGGNAATSYYGIALAGSLTFQSPFKGRGQLQKIIYMTAGEYFVIRGTSANTAVGATLNTDGSTRLKIVKLN